MNTEKNTKSTKSTKSTSNKNDNRTRMSSDDKSRAVKSDKNVRISAGSDIEKGMRSGKSGYAKDGNNGRSTNKPDMKSTQCEYHKFFVDALKDIYWAEQNLIKGLRKMSKAATSPKLAAAFDKHIAESDKQTAVIEQVFELLGEKPATKRCAAMAGLLEEADSAISDTEKNSFVRDAALIMASQKAEHYEIATYGTLAALAEYLPEKRVARLLSKILVGEKKTDGSLTKLAEEFINEYAAVE